MHAQGLKRETATRMITQPDVFQFCSHCHSHFSILVVFTLDVQLIEDIIASSSLCTFTGATYLRQKCPWYQHGRFAGCHHNVVSITGLSHRRPIATGLLERRLRLFLRCVLSEERVRGLQSLVVLALSTAT